MLDEIGRQLDAVLFFDSARRAWRRSGCSRARPRRAAPTTRRRRSPSGSRIYHEETEPVVEHYRATGKLVPLHADRTIHEVYAEVQEALGRARGRRVIIRKSAREIELMARGRRGRRRDARAARGAARAGDLDGRARPDRRRVHPLARRRPDLEGLQGLPGRDLHLAERDDRARHPGRLPGAGGRHHLLRRRRHEGRHDRRLRRRRSRSARSTRRRSACSTCARPRSRPASRPRSSARSSATSRPRCRR